MTPTPALVHDDDPTAKREVDEDDHALDKDIYNAEIEGYFEEHNKIRIHVDL